MFRFNPLRKAHPTLRVWGQSQRGPVFRRFQSLTVKKPTGIKALVKEYGYSAFGVYMALTFLDLPICYAIVHSAGKDTIEQYENSAKQVFGYGVSNEELARRQQVRRQEEEVKENAVAKQQSGSTESSTRSTWEYVTSQFSWTEFAIAYGLHKSLIVIRLPITAAITPTVVKILRGWGFNIGTASLAAAASQAKDVVKDSMVKGAKKIADPTAANPKFGTPPGKKRWWWFF